MGKKGEKFLTQNLVRKLGLDKVSVITADMLEGYTTIGGWAFYNCIGLTSIEIPNSVIRIEDAAFYDCSSLTSVTIGDNVTSIGYECFCGCGSLTSVNIPNSVTSIGYNAFYDCIRLTSVTIGNSVTTIGNYAFFGCHSLTSINIPNSVTSIGDGAFYCCINLTSVMIGDKIYKIKTIINGKCKAYKAFNADMTCRGFQYKEGETYVFKDEPKLCNQGFHACLNLVDVFNYYYGRVGKDIVVHEVKLEGLSDEHTFDSKVVAKKITIGKRIL